MTHVLNCDCAVDALDYAVEKRKKVKDKMEEKVLYSYYNVKGIQVIYRLC